MRHVTILLLAVFALAALPAAADQSIPLARGENPAVLNLDGEYRIMGTMLTPFAVDADGNTLDQTAAFDQRLRAGVHLSYRRFRVGTDWDLFTGQLFGDTWGFELDERRRYVNSVVAKESFVPRRAAATLAWPAVMVEAGLVCSHWGLGLMANDGAHDPLFGRADFGDRVVRVRVTAKPLYLAKDHPKRDTLHLTGAFDWVIADDMARHDRRQRAFQGIFSLLYADAADNRLGVYAVYRHQDELDEDRGTRAGAVDLFGQFPLALTSSGWGLVAAAEGALIAGTTDRATTYASPEQVSVLSGGAAGVVTVHSPAKRFQVHLRSGFATGDPETDDGTSRDFTFDRDFDVGMVLFDQLLGGIEGGTYDLLTDPTSSPPPDGVEAIATEGAFRRAVFVQPVLQGSPRPWLDLRLGLLLAGGSVYYAHPYYSFRAGGTPRNHLDEPTGGRHLGTEIDWAIRVGGSIKPKIDGSPLLHVIVQGGHLAPGSALQGEESEAIHQLLLTGRFRW